MEDSKNKKFINISNRKFEHKVYNEEGQNIFSYKPHGAFWLALPSEEDGCHSEWEEIYGDVFNPDEKGNLHATTFKLTPDTYVMSPEGDADVLEAVKQATEGKDVRPDEKRKMVVEGIRRKTKNSDINHVICQIDLLQDLEALEEIFCGYDISKVQEGTKYPDKVYDNMAMNMKKGLRENFAGVEVTAYALGLDSEAPSEGIDETQAYWRVIDPKYQETIWYWEIPSMAVFDTSCLDLVKEITYPAQQEQTQEIETTKPKKVGDDDGSFDYK